MNCIGRKYVLGLVVLLVPLLPLLPILRLLTKPLGRTAGEE